MTIADEFVRLSQEACEPFRMSKIDNKTVHLVQRAIYESTKGLIPGLDYSPEMIIVSFDGSSMSTVMSKEFFSKSNKKKFHRRRIEWNIVSRKMGSASREVPPTSLTPSVKLL